MSFIKLESLDKLEHLPHKKNCQEFVMDFSYAKPNTLSRHSCFSLNFPKINKKAKNFKLEINEIIS